MNVMPESACMLKGFVRAPEQTGWIGGDAQKRTIPGSVRCSFARSTCNESKRDKSRELWEVLWSTVRAASGARDRGKLF
jgi:hypothetical protein